MDEDSTSASTWQRCAAFLMALGPGAAAAFYSAMSGFYMEKFHSRSFFITMLLCLVAPQPVMSLLQQRFDAFFDEQFSTKVTYAFRVIAMQLILAGTLLVWILAPVQQWIVLCIGCSLGFVCAAIVSSSLQMVAAFGPTHIVNTKLGFQIGGCLPILVFFIAGFKPHSSQADFQRVVASAVFICVLATGVLGHLHMTSDIFTKAYKRLAYDLAGKVEHGETESLAPGIPSETQTFQRQETETAPLGSARVQKGVPTWVWYWTGCSGLLMGVGVYLASMAGFFGDSNMAQTLALLKLCMDLVGRIMASAIPFVPSFVEGPWHKVMATSVVLALGLSGVCMARLFNIAVLQIVFLISWSSVFVINNFASSLADVTTAAYTEVKDRKSVARTGQLVTVSCLLLGLLVSKATSGLLDSSTSVVPSFRHKSIEVPQLQSTEGPFQPFL